MKKITLRSLAFILALLMALMCAFVGCADIEDDDDDKDDKKSDKVTVTKENAEETLVKAYENLAEATYFSGKTTNFSDEGDGDPYTYIIDFAASNDGENVSLLTEGTRDGEEVSEKNYYINDELFSYSYGDYEYYLFDKNCGLSELFEIALDGLFMSDFEDIAEKFCLSEYEISKKDGNYVLELTLDTYKDLVKIFVNDEYFDDMADFINTITGNGTVRFTIDKNGNLVGIYVDGTYTYDDGDTVHNTMDVVFENINADETLAEPEWVGDREYGEYSSLCHVKDGVEYSYSYAEEGLWFDGARYYNDYDIEEVEYYKVLSEIDGLEVKYLTGDYYITIKNLVIPEGISFDRYSYTDLSDTNVYFEGEYNGYVPSVNEVYYKGEWSYMNGVPTSNENIDPDIPGEDIPGEDIPGEDIPGEDFPGEDDIIVGIDESAKFIGEWECVVDMAPIISGMMEVALGDMADYFDFSGFELKLYATFNEDGTYAISTDEIYLNAYINGAKDAIKDGMMAYMTDVAAQAGYSSVDEFCMDEIGMTADAYLDSVIGNVDVEEMLPTEDPVNEGRYVAKSGKIYMTTEDQPTISKNSYNKYEFADDGLSFDILAPDLEDLGDIEEGYEALYAIMLEMFPMTFTKIS